LFLTRVYDSVKRKREEEEEEEEEETMICVRG
jgi:hypothetical protein